MCTAEPDWPVQSSSSPGAAGRWCPDWCRCEDQPVCWWGSRSMGDSAASSGPGPAGPNNGCSESESEARWRKYWRMIWAETGHEREERGEILGKMTTLCLTASWPQWCQKLKQQKKKNHILKNPLWSQKPSWHVFKCTVYRFVLLQWRNNVYGKTSEMLLLVSGGWGSCLNG